MTDDMPQDLTLTVATAAYHTVHDFFPGGALGLGALLGKSNLAAEVDPRVRGAKFGLLDAVKVQDLAGDYRILYAMAAELRHYPPVPMPAQDAPACPAALRTLAEAAKEFSDLLTAVSADLADGDVSDNDLARAQLEGGELVAKVQQLLGQLAALNAAGKARRGALR